jgi:DNA-binding winged helix-turn-helix (wHTH) protein
VLAERRDRVLTRGSIYALVWGGPMSPRDRSVDVFVRKVRRKLAAASPGWTYIHTHFGIGYRLSPEPASSPLGDGEMTLGRDRPAAALPSDPRAVGKPGARPPARGLTP